MARYAFYFVLLVFGLMLAGCGEAAQKQAAGVTQLNIQVNTHRSENARPIQSESGLDRERSADADGDGDPRWENLHTNITITIDSDMSGTDQRGEATATPTTDVSPEIDANLTPGSGG